MTVSSTDGAQHTQGRPATAPTRDGRTLFHMTLDGPAPGAGPTVVFEAGMAASRSWWALVQPRVAQRTRAVVYDRAGLGLSPPDPLPRSLRRMADDLNDLLDHLEPGPFILAAHSGGGPIVRAAAADRPDRIAGLVLVDVTDEGCEVLFEPGFRRLERTAHLASVALARIGLLARLYGPGIRLLPPDAQADVRREGFTARAMRTRGEELRALVAATNRLRDHPLAAPDIPTVAISGARCDGGMSARVRAAANAAHARRAGLATRGRHVVAQRSGHMVPLTEPGLVADEIVGLLPVPGR